MSNVQNNTCAPNVGSNGHVFLTLTFLTCISDKIWKWLVQVFLLCHTIKPAILNTYPAIVFFPQQPMTGQG